ncbi:hypothetical protein ACWEJ6_54005, partial [Nonomuraea sp. NPDC004702]
MIEQAKVDGITEAVIFRETASLHGLRTDRHDFERFAAALTQAHLERAIELRERGHALPGVRSERCAMEASSLACDFQMIRGRETAAVLAGG